MRETSYWIKILKEVNENNNLDIAIEALLKESEELKKIFGSIVSKMNNPN